MILITCSDCCDLLTPKIGTANKDTRIICEIIITCFGCCALLTAKIGTANKYTKMIYMILIPHLAQPMRTLNDLRDTNHMF